AISDLVEKSLIYSESELSATGLPRFGMLQTLRDFAFERLVAANELEEASKRRALAYVQLCERAESMMTTALRLAWLRTLDLEVDNIRGALGWALDPSGDAALGCRIAASLGWFWYLRGHASEGLTWLTRLADAARSDTQRTERGRALLA